MIYSSLRRLINDDRVEKGGLGTDGIPKLVKGHHPHGYRWKAFRQIHPRLPSMKICVLTGSLPYPPNGALPRNEIPPHHRIQPVEEMAPGVERDQFACRLFALFLQAVNLSG
jgi:hypothetical protein